MKHENSWFPVLILLTGARKCSSVPGQTQGIVTRMDPWYGYKMLPSVEFCTLTVQGNTLGQCWPAMSLIQLLGLIDYRNRSHHSHCKHKQGYSFMKCCSLCPHPSFHMETVTNWQYYFHSVILGRPGLDYESLEDCHILYCIIQSYNGLGCKGP